MVAGGCRQGTHMPSGISSCSSSPGAACGAVGSLKVVWSASLRALSAFLHAEAVQRTELLLARGQPLLPLQKSQPGQPAGMPRRSVKEKLRTISNFSLGRLVEFDDL